MDTGKSGRPRGRKRAAVKFPADEKEKLVVFDNDLSEDEEDTPKNVDEQGKELSWDSPREVPPESGEESETPRWVEIGVKAMTVTAYFLTFAVILGSSVVAMGTFLFMTSQLEVPRSVSYCNKNYGRDKNLEVTSTELSRISWLWMIYFCFFTPQLFTFGRSLRMIYFKKKQFPKFWPTFLVPLIFESLHTLGLALLAFVALPRLDSIKAAMLISSVCLVPGIFNVLSRNLMGKDDKPVLRCMSLSVKIVLDVVAVGGQATAIIAWPFVLDPDLKDWTVWLIPASVILTSFGWWENYSDPRAKIPLMKFFGSIKKDLIATRYWVYLVISVWKMALFLVAMLLYTKFINNDDIWVLFDSAQFSESFSNYVINITEVNNFEIGSLPGTSIADNLGEAAASLARRADREVALQVFYIHVAAAWACYIFAKFACKVRITEFSFAFPLTISMPVVVCTIILFCALRSDDACYFRGSIPDYLFFTCPKGEFLEDFILREHGWVWLVWLLSSMWITIHNWSPIKGRLLPTEQIFCTPMYESLVLPLSFLMNRRKNDGTMTEKIDAGLDPKDPEGGEGTDDSPQSNVYIVGDTKEEEEGTTIENAKPGTYPKIIACATMWHETKDEMMACLKSIFRIDEDQSTKLRVWEAFGIEVEDYYDFETHIFFDDAFVIDKEKKTNYVINDFVKDLIEVMPEACKLVHGEKSTKPLKNPDKTPTPYGGRLVWTLPGGTKIICHLKDKNKIRHRKRWSQCMYMYYLLGYNILNRNDLSEGRKQAMLRNTFLLALDGDIDFQPKAVLLLVDLMKRNEKLGAACGRIHPIGTDGAGGLMVWYQQFEYAVGHWFQKATEHVIGCVLCSPGCFSLFRGAALVDDNVMKRYTTKSSQARHYVQFDQGEDRWLCTLMLQQGWRVEYSAASDSFTHCPEAFDEFYNQRRRWVPSTMANIMDLLQDYERTIQSNDDISGPYIAYQMLLMVGTILGPGTIFMMMTGAFNAAFKVPIMDAFLMNLIPLLMFMLCCYFFDSKIQLKFAEILTAIYAMVMMAVIVGTALQLQADGVDSPSGIFFLCMMGSFVVAGLLHPQELYCLPRGIVYYLTVPSMYLLLIIYSVFNLNNVSWGTREVPKVLSKEEEEKLAKAAEEEAKKKIQSKGIFKMFEKVTGSSLSNMFSSSGGNSYDGFISCMCCAGAKPRDQEAALLAISSSLKDMTEKLTKIEKNVEPSSHSGRRNSLLRRSSGAAASLQLRTDSTTPETVIEEDENDDDDDGEAIESVSAAGNEKEPGDQKPQERDELINPYWLEHEVLRLCEVKFLDTPEIEFWKQLLKKYLYPLDEDEPDVKKKIQGDLLALRDKVVAAFFMFNAVFVLVVMLLQSNKDVLHLNWPFNVKTNITFFFDPKEVVVSEEYLELEPVGLVFVFFFFIVLVTQFVAMLFHRLSTVMQLIATCDLFGSQKLEPADLGDVNLIKNAAKFAKIFQKMPSDEQQNARAGRRSTVHQLALSEKTKTTEPLNLKTQFHKNLENFVNSGGKNKSDVQKLRGILGKNASEELVNAVRDTMLERRNTLYPQGLSGPRRPSMHPKNMSEVRRRASAAVSSGLKRESSTSARRTSSMQRSSVGTDGGSPPPHHRTRPSVSSSAGGSSFSHLVEMEDMRDNVSET